MDEFTCDHFWRWAANHFNGDVDAACRMFAWLSRAVKDDPTILNMGWGALSRVVDCEFFPFHVQESIRRRRSA